MIEGTPSLRSSVSSTPSLNRGHNRGLWAPLAGHLWLGTSGWALLASPRFWSAIRALDRGA